MFSLKNSSDSYLKFVTASLFKNDENVYEIFGTLETFLYNKDKN